MDTTTIEFLSFRPEFAGDFKRINEEWISEMFAMEINDNALLDKPEQLIIKRGGAIWFARHSELGLVGCAALMPKQQGAFELTKMGVSSASRGLKIGEQLLVHVLEQARSMPIRRLFLLTNQKCEAAVHLYLKHGFVHDQGVMKEFGEAYERCNVAMKYEPIWEE